MVIPLNSVLYYPCAEFTDTSHSREFTAQNNSTIAAAAAVAAATTTTNNNNNNYYYCYYDGQNKCYTK
jgi:hypothetical protein